jgi:EmrB/QacA subfamily drug resistance transporter
MADTAVPVSHPPATEHEADPRRWIALFVVLTAAFMVLLDISIVNVAIPSIQRNLGASFGQVQLVLAGYQLSYAVALITGGRLGDIFGRKKLFMTGMAGFVLASASCGLARNPDMLVISRVAQGVMAALMYPQVLSVLQVVFPPRERAAAFGIFGAIIGVATITGPLLGGVLIGTQTDTERWRWIFLVNLPIGIGALGAAWFLLRESRAPRARRLDIGGTVIISAALGLLVYPLVQGREQGWPAWAFVMLVLSVPLFVLFVLYERVKTRRDGSPLVELSMFRDRAFSTGNLLSAVFFSAIPAFFLMFSITLQIGLGFSALRAGLTTVPWAIGTASASALSVRLAPKLGKRILWIGSATMIAGMVGLLLTVGARGTALSGPELAPSLLVAGLGMGCLIAPLINIILAGISQGDAGSASGVLTTMQQVGGAIGVAVVGAIFFGLVGGGADSASAKLVPQLRSELVAAGLPAPAVDSAVQRFIVCFHDRANASDPAVTPPSCSAPPGSGNNPVVATAFQRAATTALAEDFESSLQRALVYPIAVFAIVFILVFFLPTPRRQSGWGGAPAPTAGAAPSGGH